MVCIIDTTAAHELACARLREAHAAASDELARRHADNPARAALSRAIARSIREGLPIVEELPAARGASA